MPDPFLKLLVAGVVGGDRDVAGLRVLEGLEDAGVVPYRDAFGGEELTGARRDGADADERRHHEVAQRVDAAGRKLRLDAQLARLEEAGHEVLAVDPRVLEHGLEAGV